MKYVRATISVAALVASVISATAATQAVQAADGTSRQDLLASARFAVAEDATSIGAGALAKPAPLRRAPDSALPGARSATPNCQSIAEQRTICISRSPLRGSFPRGVTAQQIAPTTVVDPPTWCAAASYWAANTRTLACKSEQITVVVNELRNGVPVPVGSVTMIEVGLMYTSLDVLSWGHQISWSTTARTGDTTGLVIQATRQCGLDCTSTTPATLTYAVPAIGGRVVSENFGTPKPKAAGSVATGYDKFTWFLVKPNATPSTTKNSDSAAYRCDNAAGGSAPKAGCVIPWATGFLEYAKSRYPEFSSHLTRAKNSGLPGDTNTYPLTRTTDSNLIASNGSTACPTSWTRPAGKSCDEYPFRSTYEGAFAVGGKPYGRTYLNCAITALPQGTVPNALWSSCMINATQNSGAGGVVGAFYIQQRILENDQFFVHINTET